MTTTIAFFIDFLESDDGLAGGTERQLIEMIRHLPQAGCRTILFCLRGNPEAISWEELDGEKYLLGVTSLLSFQAFKALLRSRKILLARGVDVVHTFFFDSTVFGVLAGWLARVPLILSSRRDMGFWYSRTKLMTLRLVNRLTDGILANSRAIKSIVSQKEKVSLSRIEVIHNGFDIDRVYKSEAAILPELIGTKGGNGPVVGIVANFNRPVKRVDLFITAAAKVLDKHPSTRFLIIGGGSLQAGLKSLAKNLGIEREVIFAGPQSNALAYIKNFTIGVLCSDSEGFPNVLLEYMAASIPPVATAVGGNNEIISHGVNGLLCPPNDSVALAERIAELIENPRLRISLAQNAFRTVGEKFSLDGQITRLARLYTSGLKK
jgi:glycosyltransferase involved in cell wall biosynthesis